MKRTVIVLCVLVATSTIAQAQTAEVGMDAIVGFYEPSLQSGVKLELSGTPRCTGNAVAFPFRVVVGEMIMEIIDVFEFNEAGKVSSMKAYWGPENTV